MALTASALEGQFAGLKELGGVISTLVSAFFLFAIAIMNLVILVEIVRTFRRVTRGGVYDEAAIDAYLTQRGFFARIFRGLFKTVDRSWKMYPIGILFGLGFDTATEVGLLERIALRMRRARLEPEPRENARVLVVGRIDLEDETRQEAENRNTLENVQQGDQQAFGGRRLCRPIAHDQGEQER